MKVAAALVLLAACERDRPAAPPPAPDAARRVIAPIDAARPIDAAPIDAAPLDAAPAVRVAWIEMEEVEREDRRGQGVDRELAYPRFRTRPAPIGKELNQRVTAGIRADDSWSDYTGSYFYRCDAALVSRFAVAITCESMAELTDPDEREDMGGGAPAGPTPSRIAVWLEPGLPEISIDELTTRGAADLAIRTHTPAEGCTSLDWCALAPDAFVIDTDGVQFVPTDYCERACREEPPAIELDALTPSTPRAVELVTWLRRRAGAGKSAIEGEDG